MVINRRGRRATVRAARRYMVARTWANMNALAGRRGRYRPILVPRWYNSSTGREGGGGTISAVQQMSPNDRRAYYSNAAQYVGEAMRLPQDIIGHVRSFL